MVNVSFKKCLVWLLVVLMFTSAIPVLSAASIDTTWDFSPYKDWKQSANLPSIINIEQFPGLVASGVNSSTETWIVENGALEVVGSGRLIIHMAENSPFTAVFSDSGSGLRPTIMVSSTQDGPWTTVAPTYINSDNGITLSLDGIGEGNCYLQYMVAGTTWSSYFNHKLRTVSFNEYVPMEYVSVKCDKGITVDKKQATANEIVTITIDETVDVKAASLKVLDADGNKVAISRVGFREGETANKYTFVMPALAPVTVKLEQINSASQTNANIGGLGAQLRLAIDTEKGIYDGIRFGTQLRCDIENGTINIGGTNYTIVKCGTIITRTEILEHLRVSIPKEDFFTIDGWDTDKNAKYLINIPQTKFYDKCDEYIEFVGGITGLNSKHYDYEFAARGYVVVKKGDREYTFYTDIMTATVNELMIKTLDTKLVFNKQVNTKYYDFRECDSVSNNEFYGGSSRGVFPSTAVYGGGQPFVDIRIGKNSPVSVQYTKIGGYTKTPKYYVSVDKKVWKEIQPDVVDSVANGDSKAIFNTVGENNFFRFEFPQSGSDSLWSVTLQSISYNSIGGMVKDSNSHDFSKITDEVLARSILNEGNKARLAKVLKKAANKERIVIATIGGSITEGTGASSALSKYASLFREWWCTQYPETPIEFYNVGRGGTTSLMHVHTVDTMLLDLNPDLVVVDFTVNDTNGTDVFTESYEALIRKLLLDEKSPAIISLMMMWNGGGSVVDLHLPIVQRYDIPTISYKEALWPLIEEKVYEWADISPDYIHPNDLGHAITAKLLTNYIEMVREELDEQPTEIPVLPSCLSTAFEGAHLVNCRTTKAIEQTGFYADPYSAQFGGGWRTVSGGKLKIEVTDAQNIYLMFWASQGTTGATANIKLDGNLVATISSAETAAFLGEGTKTLELLRSNTAGTHIIEIEITSESPMDDMTVQGILVS